MQPFHRSLAALSESSSTYNFSKVPQEGLKWENRREKHLEEILISGADVICLEEVDHFSDFFQPKLKENGFEGLFKPKKYSACLEKEINNGPDGCALFYRAEKFLCIEKREVLLKNGEKEPNHCAILVKLGLKKTLPTESKEEPPAEKHCKIMEEKASEECSEAQLCIAVTHLKAGAEGSGKRLIQGTHLFSEMKDFCKDLPAIICGDFNAQPLEEVYHHFKSSEAWLESSYYTGYGEKEPPLTSWKFRPGREFKYTIDYIWYSSQNLQVKGVWGIPSEEDIGENALPGLCYPSDHIALCTEFNFKEM